MTIRVEGGDWKAGRRVRVHNGLFAGPTAISLPTGLAFGMERITKSELASVRLVTEQMHNEARNKVGAGVAGGVLLGPLGLIAGAVIGRGQKSQLVILETTDGRSALLRCKPSDLSRLLALGVGSKTQAPSPATQQSAPAPSTRPSDRQLLASTPARWALEGVGWLALFLVIAISMTTAPLIWFGLCVLAVLLGGLIWWRAELRARFGLPRAIGLVAIGAFFLLPVLFYSIAGGPPPPGQETAQTDDRTPQAVAPPPREERVAVSAVAVGEELAPSPTAAEEQDRVEPPLPPGLIGQWCDVVGVFAREMTIQDGAQGLVLVSRYSGGQVGRQPLRLRGTTYWVGDSGDVGDQLRINANGGLQLIDDEGPVRVAPRLRPGEACF